MPTTAATLIDRTRRYIRDWPARDTLTSAVTDTTGASLTVADGTLYAANWVIQIDDEAMYVTAAGSGTTVPVGRGWYGSTAATHDNGAAVLIRPAFTNVEILDGLNSALDACFPLLYRPVTTDWTGVTSTGYEYAIPLMDTLARPIPYLSKIEYQISATLAFHELRDWRVVRGDMPLVKFRRPLFGGGTLRFSGYGPFAQLASSASTLDALFPAQAESLLVEFTAQQLLMSGEANRSRHDVGPRDDREAANRSGSSSSVSNAVYQRWAQKLRSAAMPPLPPHVVSVM